MCLIIESESNPKPKIVDRPIVCYKVVERWLGDWQTPYRSKKIEIGKTYESKLDCKCDGYMNFSVEAGLHSMTDYKSAQKLKEILQFDEPKYTYEIIKCAIPKGSRYYKGIFKANYINSLSSYASDKIEYIEFC